MYFETGDRICADFRRSGNADHAPVIEYSMGDCDHYCVAFNRILSVYARSTHPDFKQEVQTYIFLAPPSVFTLTDFTFDFHIFGVFL